MCRNITVTKNFDDIKDLFNSLLEWDLEGTRLSNFIFRGESKESYMLLPTALRPDKHSELLYCAEGWCKPNDAWGQMVMEYGVLRRFYKIADSNGLEVPIADIFRRNIASKNDAKAIESFYEAGRVWLDSGLYEVAGLAQHYGLPTRFLDWSYSPYSSLYFALKGSLSAKETPVEQRENIVLWALNKDDIGNLMFFSDEQNRVDFVSPHYALNPNLNAQKGLFTHVPVEIPAGKDSAIETDRTPLDQVISKKIASIEESSNQEPFDSNALNTLLIKMIIPASQAKRGLIMLENLGYSTSRIFPGYDGVVREMKEGFTP